MTDTVHHRRYLPDANVFVAAVKNPERHSDTLALLIMLLDNPDLELMGNKHLFAEFERAAAAFPSPQAAALLHALAQGMTLIVPDHGVVAACAQFMKSASAADVVHAATCLRSAAVLISNDRDFDAIANAGLIKRLTITEAIRALMRKPA